MMEKSRFIVRVAQFLARIFYTYGSEKIDKNRPVCVCFSIPIPENQIFNPKSNKKSTPAGSALWCDFYFKKPFTMCSSASASVRPKVMSLMSCSPAILPMAAS